MSDKVDPKDRRLVTGGGKELTTRSSVLVKRGLETLRSQQPNALPERAWQEYGNAILNGLDPPFGLDIQFDDGSEDDELARVVDSTVWINRSHPAYQRALVSRSLGYHIALSVAMALAPLSVKPVNELEFVRVFMSRWGENMHT